MAAVRCFGLFRICRGSGLTHALYTSKAAKLTQPCHQIVKQCSQRISTSSLKLGNEEKNEDIKEPTTWLSNFLGYNESEETKLVDPEETKEREALFAEISDMYFAKPSRDPDLQFINRVVDCLIKYDDFRGVSSVWLIMQEMKVEPPEELIVKMENYLMKAKDESWFK